MNWLFEFCGEVAWLFNETAFFLLVGFLLAGLLRFTIRGGKLVKHFRGNNLKSVTVASLIGVPLPLCSCSVLPVAASLRKEGASRGATASFLISTPETGVDSIATSYALLDPFMTVIRPIAAFITAVVTGQMVNWFVAPDRESDAAKEEIEMPTACHDADSADHSHGSLGEDEGGFSVGKVSRYSFVTLLDELTPYLLIGFLLSGLISVLIPSTVFQSQAIQGVGGMLLMILIGVPMYVCATGSTPIAAALLMKGLNPGAVIVFLLAGPATNLGALVALRKYLGQKTLAIYLACIVVLSLAIGLLVDAIYLARGAPAMAAVGGVSRGIPAWIKVASSVLLAILMLVSVARIRLDVRWGGAVRGWLRPFGIDPSRRQVGGALAVLLVILYLSTGVSILGPGEVGWVTTFGKATREVRIPGAVLHWPTPGAGILEGPLQPDPEGDDRIRSRCERGGTPRPPCPRPVETPTDGAGSGHRSRGCEREPAHHPVQRSLHDHRSVSVRLPPGGSCGPRQKT